MTAAVERSVQPEFVFPLGSVLRATYAGGKVAVPVSNYTLFAQFEHFTAVPAGPDGGGYSISRLRVLDVLIDRLTSLADHAHQTETDATRRALAQAAHGSPAMDAAELAPGAVDQLIAEIGSKVQALLGHADSTQYVAPAKASTVPGVLMNLTA